MNPFSELRARIEALEQLHKNNERFSLEPLEARVKALEAAQNLRQRDKDVERVFKWQGGKVRAIIQPAGLVERVANVLGHYGDGAARAAIREVVAFMRENDLSYWAANRLEQEANRG
jgi:hypothetical protein